LKKKVSYLNWGGREDYFEQKDFYDMTLFEPYLYLGDDNYTAGFNGSLKKIRWAFGTGSFRMTGFQQLMNSDCPYNFYKLDGYCINCSQRH